MRALSKILLLIAFTTLTTHDTLAQQRNRRARGAVRYARPDGTVSGTTRRGRAVESTQQTEGNRRTTQSTVTGRSGESVTGTREVTREGDTVKVEREAQSTTGASREASKEIEFEDGRVEKVERESTATGRYGESIERESSAEREGYGAASFERNVETSTGREANVEGVAGVGYYGRRGVVADVDTKYHGDWDVAAGRGPYGAAVRRLPEGYRPYTYYGRPYYYYGSAYYRPYTWAGAPYYFIVPPPYGVVVTTAPVGAVMVTLAAATFYYADHVCYQKTNSGGQVAYEVVPAPEGLGTESLPPERATITLGDLTYYYYKNTFYRQTAQGGNTRYVVVTMPAGVEVVEALPAEFQIVQASTGASYFQNRETYYLPYTRATGEEVYVVVDSPTPAATAAVVPIGTKAVESSLTVAAGTGLVIRLAEDLTSASAIKGQTFSGYLDADLTVGEMLAADEGTRVHGIITEVDAAGTMSGQSKLVLTLTDIEVGGRAVPLSTSPYAVTGSSASKDTGRKIASGAGLGAMIGAIADGGEGAWKGALIGAGAGTAVSAATKGQALVIDAQTKIPFTLDQPLLVPFQVRVAAE